MKRKELLAFIFLFISASFFRFYRIEDIPFGLNNDAAWEGSAALDILRGNLSPYLPYAVQGWRGEGFFRLMVTVFTYFMGPVPLVIKLPSAIWGLLTIIPLYFLIRLLFEKKLAFITTFFVATSGWHITMSKSGWRAIGAPLFSLAAFYFLFKALKTQGKSKFVLAGVMLSSSLYTYDAARILPPFLAFWLILLALTKKKFIKTHFTGLILMSISSLIVVFPLLFYAIQHWSNFISRGDFLFVGHQIQKIGSLSPLWNNLKTSALLFNYRANGNDFFIDEPLVDQPTSWLLPIGFLIALIKVVKNRDKNYLFIFLFFLFFLIPGILSIPNGNRVIGTLPVVYFFAALGLLAISDLIARFWGSKKKLVGSLAIFAFLASITLTTYQNYLGSERRELPGFYPETYITLDYLSQLKDKNDYDFYFTDNFPRELLTFLLYNPGQENPFQKNYTWLEKNTGFLKVTKSPGKGIGFIMFDSPLNQPIATALLSKYPHAHKINLSYKNENIQRPGSIIIFVPKN